MASSDREKIALFCNVPVNAVIEERDKDFSIYEVPLSLVEHGLDELIVKKLSLPKNTLELDNWRELLHRLRNPETEISIAVVGKYAEHKDAYKSIYESIDHAGIENHAQIRIGRIQSEDVEREGPERLLSGFDGILVPGGFGERGTEGKVQAIRWARERNIPFLGICLGMQCAAIEFARNVAKLDAANSTEFDKDTPHPVICLLDEQNNITDKGGTMRLGAQESTVTEGTKSSECYGSQTISERHRHRYEFNNVFRKQLEAHGLIFAATSEDETLVEIIEVADHPWFVAVQFHPEFKSKPTSSHPLFSGFIQAAVKRSGKEASQKKHQTNS
jgi:CTP synthase